MARQRISRWRPETDGAQDWDLFFRVIERSSRIEFIDKVLYHWGLVTTSVGSGGVLQAQADLQRFRPSGFNLLGPQYGLNETVLRDAKAHGLREASGYRSDDHRCCLTFALTPRIA